MQRIIFVGFIAMHLTAIHAQTKIIAHRGFSSIAPENTLVAFQKAIESGAEYFELDIHRSKDNALMVIHDATVDRTSSNSKKGTIAQMSLAEIEKVQVGYLEKFGNTFVHEKIPTLREALELAKGKIKVCLEIKALGVEQQMLTLVEELDMLDEVIVFSFHYEAIAKVRQLNREIPTLYLIGNPDHLTADYAKVIQANAIGVGKDLNISKAFIETVHKQGIEVWMYTINEPEEIKALLNVGLDGLITNFPKRALEIRSKM